MCAADDFCGGDLRNPRSDTGFDFPQARWSRQVVAKHHLQEVQMVVTTLDSGRPNGSRNGSASHVTGVERASGRSDGRRFAYGAALLAEAVEGLCIGRLRPDLSPWPKPTSASPSRESLSALSLLALGPPPRLIESRQSGPHVGIPNRFKRLVFPARGGRNFRCWLASGSIARLRSMTKGCQAVFVLAREITGPCGAEAQVGFFRRRFQVHPLFGRIDWFAGSGGGRFEFPGREPREAEFLAHGLENPCLGPKSKPVGATTVRRRKTG